jgi:hypothetical protein
MKFKPGKYYVGDLCYALGDRWGEFCDLTIKGNEVLDGGFKFEDGTRFWTHGTMYGDGTYHDNKGREYWVDAGLIGVVSADDIDEPGKQIQGGQFIDFTEQFEPYYQDGVFFIGNVKIDTSGNSEYTYDEDDDGY